MLPLLCFILAVICWGLGAFGATRPAINWTCAGLMFAGLGLWIAPLLN